MNISANHARVVSRLSGKFSTFQADVSCTPGIAAAVALVITRDRVSVHAGGHGSQRSQATRVPQRQKLYPAKYCHKLKLLFVQAKGEIKNCAISRISKFW